MGKFQEAVEGHASLASRMEFSRTSIENVCKATSSKKYCARRDVCIYVAGSLGRLETGRKSDLDVFLLADRSGRGAGDRSLSKLEEISLLSEVIVVNDELGLPPLSPEGEFFKVQEIGDLLAGTGSTTDDSDNLFTTRLLLLLESKCIANDDLYKSAAKRVIEMYFRDGCGKAEYRPLFLLNDILRYWRTLCINYEKTRHEKGKPWWKKNLNLKFSRKMTVFATVLAMVSDHVDSYQKFEPILALTPLQRLAYALDTIDDKHLLPGFQEVLDLYEEFLAAKSHAELEVLDEEKAVRFRATSEQLDTFLHTVLGHQKLDKQLVRYLVI